MPNKREKYYPRHIGLSKSGGDASYEILVIGKDEIGALAKMVNILSEHNVNLSINNGHLDDETGKYVQVLFCDLSKADCTIDMIESELRKLKFVSEVRFANMKDRYYDQYLFPNVVRQNSRILFMSLDSMMKIEKYMIERMGSAGAVIMFQEGKDYATENVEHLNADFQPLGIESRLRLSEDILRSHGWGIFRFSKIQGGFSIVISSPPVMKDLVESRFLIGAIAGILEGVCGGRFAFDSSNYDEEQDVLSIVMKQTEDVDPSNVRKNV